MGNSLSASQKKHCQELELLIKQTGEQAPRAEIEDLIHEVGRSCPWYPANGSIKTEHWTRVAKELQEEPRAPMQLLITCHKVLLALTQIVPSDGSLLACPIMPRSQFLVLPPAPPFTAMEKGENIYEEDLRKETKAAPSLSQKNPFREQPIQKAANYKPLPYAAMPACPQITPEPLKGTAPFPQSPRLHPHPISVVRQAVNQACASGLINPGEEWMGDSPMAFPLERTPALNADGTQRMDPDSGDALLEVKWVPLPYSTLREINKAAKEDGIQSPYFRGLIETMANAHKMLPQDWKDLFKMILSPSQFTIWDQEYRTGAQARATQTDTSDQIYGSGAHSKTDMQQLLTDAQIRLVWLCVQRAIARTPEKGKANKSFSSIRQTASEPYASFIDRLEAALNRQIDNSTAAHELLLRLAFENANADCRKALQAVVTKEGVQLAEYLKACQDVGSKAHDMLLLAQAIKGHGGRERGGGGSCFNCGKSGHFRAHCRAPGGGAHKDNKNKRPNKKCPKCNKGFHWANECRSDSATYAQGNGASGNPPAQE